MLISLRTISIIPIVITPWGRHVKAALTLADVPIGVVAQELNMSRKTLERVIRGEREPTTWETRRLAEVLGIPSWFLVEGLDGLRARQRHATVGDVAEYWDISPRLVRNLCERWTRGEPGGLRHVRIGGARGAVRIRWHDVETYGQGRQG
jgi:hypothetical protein